MMMSPTSRIHRLICKVLDNKITDQIPNGYECWSEQIRLDNKMILELNGKNFESLNVKRFIEPDVFVGSNFIWRGELLVSAPSLVIEVLSKATEDEDKSDKLKLYKELGVKEYLMVNQRGYFTLKDLVNDKSYDLYGNDMFKSKVVPNVQFTVTEIYNAVDSLLTKFGYEFY